MTSISTMSEEGRTPYSPHRVLPKGLTVGLISLWSQSPMCRNYRDQGVLLKGTRESKSAKSTSDFSAIKVQGKKMEGKS